MQNPQPRDPKGLPSGGRFAPSPRSEADLALAPPPPAPVTAPAWGRELGDVLAEKVAQYAIDVDDQARVDLVEVLDMDEDALADAYGRPRADWIAGLELRIYSSSRRTARASLDGPDEWSTMNEVVVHDPVSDRPVMSDSWGDEDAPSLSRLARRCPVNADGSASIDRDAWKETNGTPGPHGRWIAEGFRDPGQAKEWRLAGFGPGEAADWDDAGFTPASARALANTGLNSDQAYSRRRRAEREAAASAPPSTSDVAGAA